MLGRRGLAAEVPLEQQSKLERRLARRVRRRPRFEQLQRLVVLPRDASRLASTAARSGSPAGRAWPAPRPPSAGLEPTTAAPAG